MKSYISVMFHSILFLIKQTYLQIFHKFVNKFYAYTKIIWNIFKWLKLLFQCKLLFYFKHLHYKTNPATSNTDHRSIQNQTLQYPKPKSHKKKSLASLIPGRARGRKKPKSTKDGGSSEARRGQPFLWIVNILWDVSEWRFGPIYVPIGCHSRHMKRPPYEWARTAL